MRILTAELKRKGDNLMKNLRKISLGLLLAMSFCALTACGNNTTKDNNGNTTTEDARDKNNTNTNRDTNGTNRTDSTTDGIGSRDGVIEDTGEAIGDGIEDLGEDIRNGAEDMGGNTNAAGERTHTETDNNR